MWRQRAKAEGYVSQPPLPREAPRR
jgi:hypothetical protein